MDALAKHLKRFSAGECSVSPGSKPFDDQGGLGGLNQQDDTNMGVSNPYFPNYLKARAAPVL
jgi:hypothetical protein